MLRGSTVNNFYFGDISRNRLEGIDHRLIDCLELGLRLSPYDFGIASGLRDAREQNVMFLRGASDKDGYQKLSKHQTGQAVDIYYWNGIEARYDPLEVSVCAGAILQAATHLGHQLRWGGLWPNLKDYGHVEIVG